jgi:glycosyltransferase involved in cell wall biosynthesis
MTHDDADTGTVLIVIPGGLEHGGGIGRQMGYFLQACQMTHQGPRYRIVDSRGPWYIGASPLHIAGAIIYFGRATLIMLWTRLSSLSVAHVNITGRGSTIRKVILSTLARAIGLRYVLHLHDYDYAEYYRSRGTFFRGLIATMFRNAEAVVVLGRRDLDVVSQSLQLRRDRMIVLHNAVPDPLPNLNRMPCAGEPCHLLFLGYLSARKGVPDLLRALASPTMKRRRWRATVAGGGPIEEFRKLADELGILDRLCFPGWLDQVGVSALCADADVLVLPSHAEGLAMSVLEGLSHGLAVITTPVGAHSEVIEPDVSGILVPPGDISALADALVSVIEDETLRYRLSRGARERFLEGFDVRRYAARLRQLHAALLAPQPNQAEGVGKGQIL